MACQDEYKNKLQDMITHYVKKDSDLGRDNANYIRSISVLNSIIKSQISKDYLLEHIYKDIPTIKYLHDSGFIYHHQMSNLSAYCIGLSAYDVAKKGLCSYAANERSSSPPKRIESLLNQSANLICLLAQEVSGATSINDLSTILAGYLYVWETEEEFGEIEISDKELENCWQTFLYNVNLPFRSGNSPFSNITLDFGQPTHSLTSKVVICGGKYYDLVYNDIPREYFDRINQAFIDAMVKGDKLGNPFTFPLVTVNVTDDFAWDDPTWSEFLEKSELFGGFYVQNYCTLPFNEKAKEINPYHDAYNLGDLYSNCCRMSFDLKDLMGVTGTNPFASGSGVGGIGVVTINLNRILWLTQTNEELLYEMLDYVLEQCCKALHTKRLWLRENWIDLYPYLAYYVKDDTSLFSIISVIGMHEGLQSCGIKNGIYDKKGEEISHKVGKYIRSKMDQFTEEYQNAFSLEFAPSENAGCTLASKDLEFANYLINNKEDGLEKVNDENLKNIIIKCLENHENLLYTLNKEKE